MNLNGYEENMFFFLTRLDYYPIILGCPWLKKHDVKISFRTYEFTFDSPYCQQNYCYRKPTIRGDWIPPIDYRKTFGIPSHRIKATDPIPLETPKPKPSLVCILEIRGTIPKDDSAIDSSYESLEPKPPLSKRNLASRRGKLDRKRRRN